MHPIVSSLTNGVPCFSIDNWGTVDFWGNKKSPKSSKVYDVLGQYGLTDYWCTIENGKCNVTVEEIVEKINHFPIDKVKTMSAKRVDVYKNMMERIILSFGKE